MIKTRYNRLFTPKLGCGHALTVSTFRQRKKLQNLFDPTKFVSSGVTNNVMYYDYLNY